MSQLGRQWIFLLMFFTLFGVTSCNSMENSNDVKIVQFVDFYPNRSYLKEKGRDAYHVVALSEKTYCGSSQAMLSPASVGISENGFQKMWNEWSKNTAQDRFYKLTYGECIRGAVVITKVVDCAKGACGKAYQSDDSKIWLDTRNWAGNNIPRVENGEYFLTKLKSSARYFITLPLKEAPEKNAWKVEIRYADNPDVIAMDAYVNNPDFLSGKFILDYKAYYLSGNLYREGSYDRQGRMQGKSVIYYDVPNKIRTVFYRQDDQLQGEYVSYHENGNVETKRLYRNDIEITKNGVVYGPNGEVLTRYSYNESGLEDGPQIRYYPDGKVMERETFSYSTLIGTGEYYWPNGNLKRKEIYKNANLVREEEWYESGQKQSLSVYDRKYPNTTGTYKAWHENGQLSQKTTYINGKIKTHESWWKNGKRFERAIYSNSGELKVNQLFDEKGKQIR